MIILNAAQLLRIHSIGVCAADRERASVQLAGVFVKYTPQDYHDPAAPSPATLTICATDGKILVEEVHTVVAEGEPDPWELTISPEGWTSLKAWCKPHLGTKAKGPREVYLEPEWLTSTDAKTGAVEKFKVKGVKCSGLGGVNITLPYIDGCFPAYGKALEIPFGTPDTTVRRHGINAEYVGRLAVLWSDPYVSIDICRGWIIAPLKRPDAGGDCRALIMPISMPR
jgi:hypothetical protein